jgi:hypothetical protein
MSQPTGQYCSLTDIQNVFGISNITLWSNLDNTGNTTDTTRVTAALAYADDEIDNFFRGGPYAVPLVLNSGSAPLTWAAKLAGIWLYDSRGQLDTPLDGGGPGRGFNRYSGMKKSVYIEMGLYRIGYKQLDAIRSDQLPSGPVVVVT